MESTPQDRPSFAPKCKYGVDENLLLVLLLLPTICVVAPGAHYHFKRELPFELFRSKLTSDNLLIGE